MVSAVTATPYDAEAAETAMTTLRTEVATLMERAQAVVLDHQQRADPP